MRHVAVRCGVVLGLIVALGSPPSALAASYTFTTIDVPGAFGTVPSGINDAGQVVGSYFFGGEGFVLDAGTFSTIHVPGSITTTVRDINHAGDIVGYYSDDTGFHGFLLQSGVFTPIDVPAATIGTFPDGLNDSGQIVGYYGDADGTHGFLLVGGTVTTIDVPGATFGTEAHGINEGGQIVGHYGDDTGQHGFLLTGGSFRTIDFPGMPFPSTVLHGINDAGQIVGRYGDGSTIHGFVVEGNDFAAVDFPGSTLTDAYGINNAGQIVGNYHLAGESHGFLATPEAGALLVSIDIKPGVFPNIIPLRSMGTVPVAILGTATFDAGTVDPTTVTLASAGVDLKRNGRVKASLRDVNRDGFLDLMLYIDAEALQLSVTDIQAVLEGQTFGGIAIRGTDSIRVVPWTNHAHAEETEQF